MDYKQTVDTIKFHALYSDLNGAESKIIMLMLSSANYKTGIYSGSYGEIAQVLGIAKTTVSKAIAGLIEKQAIAISGMPSGRSESSYRLRTADDLYEYFTKEEKNATIESWYQEEESLFGEVSFRYAQTYCSEECEECESDDNPCAIHKYHRKKIEETQQYKDWQMWLKDNPKPEYTIKTINGRQVI